MSLLRPLLVAAVAAAALAAPATALGAEPVFETMRVESVDGALINVEIARPAGDAKVPVILTYSPYNTLGEYTTPNLANDALAEEYLPKGYARAVADVLGTRNSSGCWDYGGPKEQQSGVDVVNALASAPWSNGRVGMIGGSYDGTTANMVAARGEDVPGLKAIVPQAAISRWYGYAYQDGVRYFLNSENPTDEGVDTPLAFDFGLARTPPTHPDAAPDALPERVSPCDSAAHTEHGYDRTPDYDDFWRERDYLKDADRFRAAVLVTHGWQDYNVKQSEGLNLWAALGDEVPFKKLFVFQGQHGVPDHEEYATLLDRFFARTLLGERNGIESEPAVWTEGRSGSKTLPLRTETRWPPKGTTQLSLSLERTDEGGVLRAKPAGSEDASYTDMGTGSEELAREDLFGEHNWLTYATSPLDKPLRLVGSPVLDASVVLDADHGQLAPTLLDVAPDGSTTAISRGFLNLQYRDGLDAASPVPAGEPVRGRVRLAPQDQTIPAGHRLALLVESSNVVWALPDDPGYSVTVRHGGASRLVLPVRTSSKRRR